MRLRRLAVPCLLTALAAALVAPSSAAPSAEVPQDDRIPLPRGFEPEGIAIDGDDFFTGSLVGRGIVTGRFDRDGTNPFANLKASIRGMRYDQQSGWLYAVGSRGSTGLLVALSDDGIQLRVELPTAQFPNDITFTRNRVHVTDSGRNVLYQIYRDRDPGGPEPPDLVRTLRLTGVPPVTGDDIALNGIRTLPGGRLVVVDSRDGVLYAVDRSDGTATPIPVTGDEQLTSGDGLVLDDDRLWVVRGQGGNEVVQLQADRTPAGLTYTDGQVLTDDDLSVPSTAVKRGGVLWLANARFGVDTNRFYLSRLPVAS